MLKIEHHKDLRVSTATAICPGRYWSRKWYGYFHPPEVSFAYPCDIPVDDGSYSYLELVSFLGVIEHYANRPMVFFELGAGIGHMCMMLAGIINYKIIKQIPSGYELYAVEADQTHFNLAVESLASQLIDANVIHAAVTKSVGVDTFFVNNPYRSFGQYLHVDESGLDSVVVDTITVDHIISCANLNHVSLIHMDVQAEESNVIIGAMDSIKEGIVEHFIIETHTEHNEIELRKLLSPYYNLIVDMKRFKEFNLPGFQTFDGNPGLQVWQLKGI